MDNIVKLIDCGISERSSRIDGIKIKDNILSDFSDIHESDKIIIDFSDIDYVSTGFAKELIGSLYRDHRAFFKKHIILKVNGNDTMKNIIMIALSSM